MVILIKSLESLNNRYLRIYRLNPKFKVEIIDKIPDFIESAKESYKRFNLELENPDFLKQSPTELTKRYLTKEWFEKFANDMKKMKIFFLEKSRNIDNLTWQDLKDIKIAFEKMWEVRKNIYHSLKQWDYKYFRELDEIENKHVKKLNKKIFDKYKIKLN